MLPFKLLIHPKVVNDGKGGASFRKAQGIGKIEVKCEGKIEPGESAKMTFRISIGSGKKGDTLKVQPPRGPVTHDFAESGTAGLPRPSKLSMMILRHLLFASRSCPGRSSLTTSNAAK